MEPTHYRLAKAAKILNWSEEDIIQNAAWNYDGRGLTIYILTAPFFVVPIHIDAKGIRDEYSSIPAKIEALTLQCLQEREGGNHEVIVQLKPKPFFELNGSQNGYFHYELKRKNMIYPLMEDLREAVKKGIDLDSITPPPVRLNECVMVVLAEDLEKFKNRDNKGLLQTDNEQPWRDIDIWLFETWQELGMPGGTAFFKALKKFEGKKGSPIHKHFGSGNKPSFDWRTENASDNMSIGRLRNMVTGFKKNPIVKKSVKI
jgi:hypothetical protein